MRDPDTEWQIGETMAEVLRERLVELETLEATGAATEETVGRLALPARLEALPRHLRRATVTTTLASRQRGSVALCPAAGDRALPHLQRAAPDRLWPYSKP
jgi:hypothetical protein